jgi:hypothetical protein
MTLTQRKLNKALGEDWFADYLRRRQDGWSQKEIAAFYKIHVGKITESCVCKWARKERKQEAA